MNQIIVGELGFGKERPGIHRLRARIREIREGKTVNTLLTCTNPQDSRRKSQELIALVHERTMT
ncbi:hypothetical protein B5V89_15815 [Heyndrickxia sporothermodurans]|nr:hypothetical protein B5V89_15815 [Heyndrickxia sporothermodurans]